VNALAVFVRRPVATTLLTLAVALSGVIAFVFLPISSLPQIDLPSIGVSANLPGASPETMAATVATPLERALGRIAGITEMTSTSTQGASRISLQFDLSRDPDGAAREVQSAINAARALLPTSLPTNPTYRKVNAASSPILAIALTSAVHTQEQLYDVAFTILGQKIAQIRGVGQVNVNGSALRSVRVEVDPTVLNHNGVSLAEIRTALAAANVNLPKGFVENAEKRWQIDANDRRRTADDYRDLVVAWNGGSPIRLGTLATVRDSVQELRNAGSSGGKPAVMLAVMNQPGANIVETVDAVRALLPRLRDSIPAGVDVNEVIDRSTTIRSSLREIEHTLLVSIGLVVLVTYAFLRSGRATLIPAIAIPVSLLGTLSVIHLCGYSLNNLSLMALIISTGFVVDDAIVVVENVTQHIEAGKSPFDAALAGVREVGFTVVAMSLSLVAVFIPLLFMGGVIGRLFREFAVTLSVSVLISMVVSLTTTPMLCARLLRRERTHRARLTGRLDRALESLVTVPLALYDRTLTWALRRGPLMLALVVFAVGLNVYLYTVVPKGFFPLQDTGRLNGNFQGDQSVSFEAMRSKIQRLMHIVSQDPDVDTYYEYSGSAASGQSNTGNMFALLKPLGQRKISAQKVVDRLRPKLATVPGAQLILTAQQDLNIGARAGAAQFQYTLLASELSELRELAPKLRTALVKLPELTDVSSDYQDKGLQTQLVVDRGAAARLGITARQIDTTLNDAFGQRLVSTIYEPLNQYYVVLTVAAPFKQSPAALDNIYLTRESGEKVPLSAVGRWDTGNAPLAVNHQGQFAAATLSFNLAPGVSLEQGTAAVEAAFAALNPPETVRGRFAGAVQVFRDALDSQPWLVAIALLAVYVVLGMLYESTLHPITILSTLPSAGVGALLALLVFDTEFTIIALIGVILLVGIVKKNAIILIDCALQIEARSGVVPAEAIRQACLQRFRPIVMTTLAALLGALPLALGAGNGAELRRPLGISIVGGLIVSQLLTLYTTPVVYLYLARFRAWLGRQTLSAGQTGRVSGIRDVVS
jgi:multidrug efflux pump